MPRRHKGMNEGSGSRATLSFLVYDIMETHYGEWFTLNQLVEQARLIRVDEDIDPEAIKRACWRHLKAGRVQAGVVVYEDGKPTIFRVPDRDYWKESHAETDDRNGGAGGSVLHIAHTDRADDGAA